MLSPARNAGRSTRWSALNRWSWRGWTAIWMKTTNRLKKKRRTSESWTCEDAGRSRICGSDVGGGSRGAGGGTGGSAAGAGTEYWPARGGWNGGRCQFQRGLGRNRFSERPEDENHPQFYLRPSGKVPLYPGG